MGSSCVLPFLNSFDLSSGAYKTEKNKDDVINTITIAHQQGSPTTYMQVYDYSDALPFPMDLPVSFCFVCLPLVS